jgi:hypothetical protein
MISDSDIYFRIDWYNNFVMLFVGFFETFGAGWIYAIEKQCTSLGCASVFTYMATHFVSVLVACGFWFGLSNGNEVWGGFVAFFCCFITGCLVSGYFLLKQMKKEPGKWTWQSIIYELTLSNVMSLRDEVSSLVGYLPWIWAFALKNIIPHILLILIINLATSKNSQGKSLFGHYEGYGFLPFQLLGILLVCFAASFVSVGVIIPQAFQNLDSYKKTPSSEPQSEAEDHPSSYEMVGIREK